MNNDLLLARIAALEAGIQQLSAEYHSAINEPEYAGTRLDWIHRCQAAEARVTVLEATLKVANERIAKFEALMKRF